MATQVAVRAGSDALLVNWFELTITPEKTGAQLFHNGWLTNHWRSSQTVAALAQVAPRGHPTRWKIENQPINVLKNQGYHRSTEAHVEASNITWAMTSNTFRLGSFPATCLLFSPLPPSTCSMTPTVASARHWPCAVPSSMI